MPRPSANPGLGKRSDVEEADAGLAVECGAGFGGLTRSDSTGVAAEARGVPARVQVDVVDDAGVHDRRSETYVVEARGSERAAMAVRKQTRDQT